MSTHRPYADACNACLSLGWYVAPMPVAARSWDDDGGVLIYRCDWHHSWTCGWSNVYGDPVFPPPHAPARERITWPPVDIHRIDDQKGGSAA